VQESASLRGASPIAMANATPALHSTIQGGGGPTLEILKAAFLISYVLTLAMPSRVQREWRETQGT